MTDPTTPAQPATPPENPYQQATAGAPAAPLTEAEDKQWAMFAHFGGILGLLPSLIIYLVFKDRGAKTRVESKEALNWQITWIAANIVLVILVAIITGILGAVLPYEAWGVYVLISGLLGFLTWVPWLANVVFSIIGGVKVNGGGSYRYPFAVRLIK